jgi:DNA-binding XRE family transcriptional regulator
VREPASDVQDTPHDDVVSTRQTVIAIERAATPSPWRWRSRFARVFGVPLDEVFHYTETEHGRST